MTDATKTYSKEELALAKLGFCYDMADIRKGMGQICHNPEYGQAKIRFCITDYFYHVDGGHVQAHPDIRTREQYQKDMISARGRNHDQ